MEEKGPLALRHGRDYVQTRVPFSPTMIAARLVAYRATGEARFHGPLFDLQGVSVAFVRFTGKAFGGF
jgi:hypothetical protein